MLMVSPSALNTQMEVRMESGIEIAMISVLRQLPRNSRIMMAVRQAAMMASRTTPLTAARTNMDWSDNGFDLQFGRKRGGDLRQHIAHCCTISSVDALPIFITVSSAPRWPSRRTMLVCGE